MVHVSLYEEKPSLVWDTLHWSYRDEAILSSGTNTFLYRAGEVKCTLNGVDATEIRNAFKNRDGEYGIFSILDASSGKLSMFDQSCNNTIIIDLSGNLHDNTYVSICYKDNSDNRIVHYIGSGVNFPQEITPRGLNADSWSLGYNNQVFVEKPNTLIMIHNFGQTTYTHQVNILKILEYLDQKCVFLDQSFDVFEVTEKDGIYHPKLLVKKGSVAYNVWTLGTHAIGTAGKWAVSDASGGTWVTYDSGDHWIHDPGLIVHGELFHWTTRNRLSWLDQHKKRLYTYATPIWLPESAKVSLYNDGSVKHNGIFYPKGSDPGVSKVDGVIIPDMVALVSPNGKYKLLQDDRGWWSVCVVEDVLNEMPKFVPNDQFEMNVRTILHQTPNANVDTGQWIVPTVIIATVSTIALTILLWRWFKKKNPEKKSQ